MAEIRNTFVKSKMNKDLDDRLLSKGEYRNAENVQISRSEGEDVGALENILGNKFITNWSLNTVGNLEIIGYTIEEKNDRAFFMATNYTDVSSNELDNPAPYGAACYILMFDNRAVSPGDRYKVLVEGRFLNLSKTHPIYGIDLIEELLFWTDNRNQPRKINITKAIASSTHYTTEDQISVAKYYPYQAPYLYDYITLENVSHVGTFTQSATDVTDLRIGMELKLPYVNNLPIFVREIDYTANEFVTSQVLSPALSGATVDCYFPTSKNVTEPFLTPSLAADFVSTTVVAPFTITFTNPISALGISANMKVSCPGNINETVLTISNPTPTTVVVDKDITTGVNTVAALDKIEFSDPNPNYTSSWPGDPTFLSDKFVRFAYRFRFEDGEYSVISPFTQPAFIPKQDGYIRSEIGNGANATNYISQEEQIRASTIVSFFENKVQSVEVKIPTPYAVNELASKLKISDLEILYKESDGLAIQVLETISVTDSSITGNSSTVYSFDYQSRRPFKTLPERETLRVFDKVPIRAMTQSTSGNRLIYGNFIDKHTPPENLDYSVQISPKIRLITSNTSFCTVAYPTHNVKQNRTYQIGIVLADRYGRQSDVVLSSITDYQYEVGGENYDSSTIFNPYKSADDNTIPQNWFGDSLKVLFRSEIPSSVSYADGYPGLYKSGTYTAVVTPAVTSSDNIVVSSLDPNIAVGDIIDLGGGTVVSIKAIDTVTNTITVSSNVTIAIDTTITINGPENKLGWYSYKVVVKQLKQEYYNAYLPNILSGSPNSISNNYDESYTTLFSDNINKIPTDLAEVQPEQTQFRTSDTLLYPRVAGTGTTSYNIQYNLGEHYITADTIGKLADISPSGFAVGPPYAATGIYNPASNPPIARLSTYNKQIGAEYTATYSTLAIAEVDPLESRLQIYYETSTSGLISELNIAIDAGSSANPVAPDPPYPTVPS